MTYPELLAAHDKLIEEHAKLRERHKEALGHLVCIMSDSWTYVHGWCTIKSVFAVWDRAREFCGKPQ